MSELLTAAPTRTWSLRIAYGLICLGIILLQLLPLQTMPRDIAGPEIMLIMTFAFALRRPELVPPALVGSVALLADLLLQRPPGLMAGLTVVATQALRNRSEGLRTLPFSVEWLTAALALTAVLLGFRIALAIFMISQPPILLTFTQIASSALFYPVMVIGVVALFGMRRVAPGEMDTMGHRL
ncbi:rod shape-determining protein MreD [Pseudooceanicola sp. C21-150M6]|uniref:rod shape-determining protein MreD n=1 Tax=Pseudooceanicola sp. C21-150M6 TaxID=3434355 RepID=UPI003D7F9466